MEKVYNFFCFESCKVLDCRFFEYSQYAIDNLKCLGICFDLEDPPEGLCHIYSVKLSHTCVDQGAQLYNTLRTRNLNLFIDFVLHGHQARNFAFWHCFVCVRTGHARASVGNKEVPGSAEEPQHSGSASTSTLAGCGCALSHASPQPSSRNT